ncbi:MAG: cation:proton antiporter [Dehalococcoidia bacterium]
MAVARPRPVNLADGENVFEHGSLFYQLAIVLLLATAIGAVGRVLRQPLIVSFILAGIIAGPTGFHIIDDEETWDLFATIGVALLLFMVGLKLDLHVIRRTGPVALITGLGQVAFTASVGYLIAIGLGLAPIAALYVAVALTFSSTIIIVKLLSDKREIEMLHGRVAVGLLIVQDIVVVLVMIGLSSFGAGAGEQDPLREALLVLGRGLGFLVAVVLLTRFVLPRLFGYLARSQELLVLGAIAWAVSASAAAEALGFSMEVGAFLAGIALAATAFRESVSSRLVTMRDFLLLFFFVVLGASLDLSLIFVQLGTAIVLSLFVLIGNPIIVMLIMRFMGYRKRTGFLTGLTVAQISEFSLILAALGLTLGHIDAEIMALITLVGLITIAGSTYLILYSHPIYNRLVPLLGPFESTDPHRELQDEGYAPPAVDIVMYGVGRYGGELLHTLSAHGVRVLAVDFDPQVVRELRHEGIRARYGDADDPDFPHTLPLDQANWLLATLPLLDSNLALIRCVRAHGFTGRIAVRSHDNAETALLKRAGADVVLELYLDAAAHAADRLVEEIGTRNPARIDLHGERVRTSDEPAD